MDLKVKKIYATWVYVRDLEESRKFYKDNLGLKLKFQDKDWIEFDLGQTSFAILKRQSYKTPLKPQKTRIMFLVENIKDWKAHLLKDSVKLIGDIRVLDYGKLLTFEDPNGHWLELFELR